MRTALLVAVAAMIALLIAFDVQLNPEFALPRTVERPDAAQEAKFAACVAERDGRIHEETFARIDNPDVQREVLAARKADAKRACRAEFPQRTVTVEEPMRINLIDLRPRF